MSRPLAIHLLDVASISEARSASRRLLRHVLGPRVVRSPLGRPLGPGERPDSGSASAAHDGGVLVVAHHPGGCGVDVEDLAPDLLAEVAPRFCAPDEPVTDPRAAWVLKESVTKSLGLGLTAGLRTVRSRADARLHWSPAVRAGVELDRITRVVATSRRDLAVTVVAPAPPPVLVRCWSDGPATRELAAAIEELDARAHAA